MDLLKAKIYLDKINREFARMLKDPENVPRIDIDITLSYMRELYDAFLSEQPKNIRVAAAPPQPVVAAPPTPAPPPVVVAPPAPPPPVVVAPPAPPPPPIVVAPPPPPVVVAPPPPAPVAVQAPPVVEVVPDPPAPAPPAVPAPGPAPEPPSHKPPVAVSESSAEVLFEYKEAKELSEKLSDMPIADLKRAIALNDKLLLTRELFGGDGAAFDQTLNALNDFSGFEQAKSYLIKNCISTYDWLDKKKAEAAKGFIRLIRRRYK